MYKTYFEANYRVKVISVGFINTLLDHLKPFTLYIIEICAFNAAGNGPTDYVVVKTLEAGT